MTLPEGTWEADPDRSEVGFAVKDMWGLRTVRGRFGAYDARLTVREGAATGELAIGSSRTRLEIPVTVEPADGGALRLDGTTAVSREAAGLPWNRLGMIRGDARLHARLTLRRTAPR